MRSNMPEDVPSLRALKSGDPAALAALFEAHADKVYRLALGLLRDPAAAEDIVQETFLAALTHLDRFEGRSSLSTWLYRVAYNATQDHLRRREGEPLPAEEPDSEAGEPPMPQALLEWTFTPEQVLADAEAGQQMDLAIGTLPRSMRAVFILRDIEGLSTDETAEALGLSPGAVKVRLHRGRLALRERLSGYFAERLARKGEE
jgi:RNA polymerase sigma-70 factor (ECF subfamily)